MKRILSLIAKLILILSAFATLSTVTACLEPLEEESNPRRWDIRYHIDESDAVLVYEPPLVYPEEAVAEGWEGAVQVLVYIRTDGTVSSCQLLRSSGHDALDQSALGAASLCLFEPYLYRGEPALSATTRWFLFELDAAR